MVFSRGAVLEGRVDGASTAYERGIEYDASAKTCARARGAQGQKQVCKIEIKNLFARVSSVLVGKRDIQRAETFLLSIPWPQWSSQKASQPEICWLETLDFDDWSLFFWTFYHSQRGIICCDKNRASL